MKRICDRNLLLIALCSCNPAAFLDSSSPTETKPSDDSCSLYTKKTADNYVATTRIAIIAKPELIGGTEAEKAALNKGNHEYDAYWSCSALSMSNTTYWCECPRLSNKSFEDKVSAVNTRVIWITREVKPKEGW